MTPQELEQISQKAADAQSALYALAIRKGIDGTPLATELMAIHSNLGDVVYDTMIAAEAGSALVDDHPSDDQRQSLIEGLKYFK